MQNHPQHHVIDCVKYARIKPVIEVSIVSRDTCISVNA